MMKSVLVPPCAYQGGKQRLAKSIVDAMDIEGKVFYDLCCGSGAVSLEVLRRGGTVVMLDKGCFGRFYESVGNSTFDLSKFREKIDGLPDKEGIQVYMKELAKGVASDDSGYDYLLLQAASFGSKQIWLDGNKWCNTSFRSYWLPTETSNRRSPVNPMMPMPETLYSRVEEIMKYKDRITGYCADIEDIKGVLDLDKRPKVVYIDPPYRGTTGYGFDFDITEWVRYFKLKDYMVYISEKEWLEGCLPIILSESREKGNINGKVKKGVREVLNVVKNGAKNLTIEVV